MHDRASASSSRSSVPAGAASRRCSTSRPASSPRRRARSQIDGRTIDSPGPGARRRVPGLRAVSVADRRRQHRLRTGEPRLARRTGRRDASAHWVSLVRLDGSEDKYPHELSGGMRQRCALARCLANDPDVLLMDEPLAALDALTRVRLQDELLEIWNDASRERPKSALYITHAIDEALYLADRIIVMSRAAGAAARRNSSCRSRGRASRKCARCRSSTGWPTRSGACCDATRARRRNRVPHRRVHDTFTKEEAIETTDQP